MMAVIVSQNHEVAAKLAGQGFSVFPCQSSGINVKKPCAGIAWRSVSTNDAKTIDGWWQKWPEAAPAIDLSKSGLIVIDADRHGVDDGVEAYGALMEANGWHPDLCPLVATPNEGNHHYFRQSVNPPMGNARGNLPAGIDVRGAGGYVLAPGAMLGDGRTYELFGDLSNAPRMPDWLIKIIQAPKAEKQEAQTYAAPRTVIASPSNDMRISAYVQSAIDAECRALANCGEGGRNHQLNVSTFSLAQFIPGGHLSRGQVEGLMTNAALSCGLKQPEIRKTIASGMKSGEAHPRVIPAGQDSYDVVEAEAVARQLLQGQDGVLYDADTGEIIDENELEADIDILPGTATDQFDYPDAMLKPGGLVEDIANWICEWTSTPVRIHAVAAALTVVATIIGRKCYSMTRPTGPQLYLAAIAPSGAGKQHPQDCARMLLDLVEPSLHSGWQASGPALATTIFEGASRLMIVDEFADKFSSLKGKNVSGSISAINEVFRELWGSSLGVYVPPRALVRSEFKVYRPCMSFFGASTLRDFREGLSSKDVTNGLFNRFLIMPRFDQVKELPDREGLITVPNHIIDQCKWLFYCLPLDQVALSKMGDSYASEPVLMPFSDDAKAMNIENVAYQKKLHSQSENDMALALYGRYAEQIKRVAMIVAAGRNAADLSKAKIEKRDMDFAGNLVRWSIEQFVLMVRRDMVESLGQAQFKLVLEIVRQGKQMDRTLLYRKIHGRIKRRELDDILVSLCEGNNVQKVVIELKKGRPRTEYRYIQG